MIIKKDKDASDDRNQQSGYPGRRKNSVIRMENLRALWVPAQSSIFDRKNDEVVELMT